MASHKDGHTANLQRDIHKANLQLDMDPWLPSDQNSVGPERPRYPSERPKHDRVFCVKCDDHPDGFRGEHELRRHQDRMHNKIVKKWVCIEPSGPEHPKPAQPLLSCKACTQQKKYNAYYNAAAHLRRAHFRPKAKPRGKSSKVDDANKRGWKAGGDWPMMSELKHWMMEVEEQAIDQNTTSTLPAADEDEFSAGLGLEELSAYEDEETSAKFFDDGIPTRGPRLPFIEFDGGFSGPYIAPPFAVGVFKNAKFEPGEPEGMLVEAEVPFTDSGYKSAPNIGYLPGVQADPEQSPSQPKVLAMGDKDKEDARTLYSIGSTIDLANAQKCIVDISSDMFGKLRDYAVDPNDRAVFSRALPDLIKAFAFKICHDYPSQENRDIMYFIHKRHK